MVLLSLECPHLEHGHGPVVPGMSLLGGGTRSCCLDTWNVLTQSRDMVLLSRRLPCPHLEQGHGPVVPEISSLRAGTWSCGPWNVLTLSWDMVLFSLECSYLEQ